MTRKVQLTQERVRELLDYNPRTGDLKWRVSRGNPVKAGDKAGSLMRDGHLEISIDGHRCLVHRVIWLHVYGRWPNGYIDHIDGNPSNNRIENLRDVRRQINQQNQRRARADNRSTGLLGAYYNARAKRHFSSIGLNGKSIHLGYFDSAQEAHEAYVRAKRELHEGCTI